MEKGCFGPRPFGPKPLGPGADWAELTKGQSRWQNVRAGGWQRGLRTFIPVFCISGSTVVVTLAGCCQRVPKDA